MFGSAMHACAALYTAAVAVLCLVQLRPGVVVVVSDC